MKLHRLLTRAPSVALAFSRRPLAGLLVLAALTGPFCENAKAAAYTFTNIADTSGIFPPSGVIASGLGTAPLSINNSGTVAFSSRLTLGGNGVFRGNGGPLTNIALSSDPIFLGVGGASINAAGTVAFAALLETGGEGVFTGNGGAATPIALTSELNALIVGNPVINDAGTVGFQVTFTDSSRGILTRNGGSTATIALESGPIFSSLGGNLSINSAGTVAFVGGLDSGPGQGGAFTGSGGSTTTIVFGEFPGTTVSINDAGRVAFPLGGAIFSGNGGSTTTIADTSGPFSQLGFNPSINNLGTVAFWAALDGGSGSGVYVGPDPLADKVIRTGDSLFGGSVSRLSMVNGGDLFGNVDINDLGQVAFHYELVNGRQGIAVATPVVPEPGVTICALLGALLLGTPRRRHSASPRNHQSQHEYGID